MKEVWKDIPGYEGLYQASTSGEVKSLPHYTVSSSGKKRFFGGGLVAPQKGTGGYYHVVLHKNGNKTTRLLNRIILITFMVYKAGCDANHLDENPGNNRLDNLEWTTRKENCNYGNRNKRISESKKGIDTAKCCDRIGALNPNSVKVYALNKDMTINKVYSCSREAGVALGVSESTISRRARHLMESYEYRGLLWYNQVNLPDELRLQVADTDLQTL
jgi:hypothetical protein